MRVRVSVCLFLFAAMLCPAVRGQLFSGSILYGPVPLVPMRLPQSTPYSLVQVQTTVQTLSNGTQVRNHNETHVMRDAAGRTRTETYEERRGELKLTGIHISDPIEKRSITLFTLAKVAEVRRVPGLQVPRKPRLVPEELSKAMQVEAEARRELSKGVKTTLEKLGTMEIAGEHVEGSRVLTVIPAGEQGNDAELRTVSETWNSRRLGMPLRVVRDDPRMGHHVQEITELHFEAPDPALFQLPADYRVFDLTTEGENSGPASLQ